MPYVPENTRLLIDRNINELVYGMRDMITEDKRGGACNYAISVLLLRALKPDGGWNYRALAEVHSVLDCASKEIYRRLTSSYEDNAIRKNGDIPELSELGIGGNFNATFKK